MKVITPTPSQAAVVLRKFLQQGGVEIPLSLAQEASARMRGYADWQALVSDVEPRTGQHKGASLGANVDLQNVTWTVEGAGGAGMRDERIYVGDSVRLFALLLNGEAVFTDAERGALTLRHTEPLGWVVFSFSDGSALTRDVLESTALTYENVAGQVREISVRQLVFAHQKLDKQWTLEDGTTFSVTQAQVSAGSGGSARYLAPAQVSFSSGEQVAGFAYYDCKKDRVSLSHQLDEAISRDFNRVVTAVWVEIGGRPYLAASEHRGFYFLENTPPSKLEELPFGTPLGGLKLLPAAFISYGAASMSKLVNWDAALQEWLSQRGSSPVFYAGDGQWRQKDSDEYFTLYDESRLVLIPHKSLLFQKKS
jgi:hypothetical protein